MKRGDATQGVAVTCRHCGAPLRLPMADLGSAPPSNDFADSRSAALSAKRLPLRVLVCEACWLAQTGDFVEPSSLFRDDYAYFSGCSSSWLAHSQRYVAAMVDRFGLGGQSHVVEVAANDGYLLQFVKERGIPCTGIEPTRGTAAAARAKGISVVEEFFTVRSAAVLAERGLQADLMPANNVLAHVPDINDFTRAFGEVLKPGGVATFEFPDLLRMVEGAHFDIIYHEHYSYLSLHAVDRIFKANGLAVFDVEELPTQGGSLRVFAQRSDTAPFARSGCVDEFLSRESAAGVTSSAFYRAFQAKADKVRADFKAFLDAARAQRRRVAGYGAAAKGNTLLNFAGTGVDDVAFIADRNPAKQGKFCPGSGIPIVDERRLKDERPEFVVIFPWNLRDELLSQLDYVRGWGGRFVTALPELSVIE